MPAVSTMVRVGTQDIAVHDWGGEGAPILLAHATGFHGLVWRPVAERLVAAGRHVWSFDFRGHGDSDRSTNGYAW
ncbi:MAG TPA: alpha/beta hydrolase, partial [Chloroflexi bacterium]|nr:alpha/beta hydrolase [Chloroflexota bacterium]